MAITVTCTNCGKQYRVKDSLAGKAVACKKCKNRMTISKNNVEAKEFDEFVNGILIVESENTTSQSRCKSSRQRTPHPREGQVSTTQDTENSKSGPLDVSVGEITFAGWLLVLAIASLTFLAILFLLWDKRFGGPGIALVTLIVAAFGFVGAKRFLNAYGVAVLKGDRAAATPVVDTRQRTASSAKALGIIPAIVLVAWIVARLWLANRPAPPPPNAQQLELLEQAKKAKHLLKNLEDSGIRFDGN